MKNAKKYICFLVLSCVLCTHIYNVYQTCYASELVVAGGLASAGTALLGLLAISGVGMELENNRKFNELSDEEKSRIETGLVQNYEEVALQRGASLEKIKTWTNNLCNGVLDKASECWGIFKDWAKNISISDGTNNIPQDGAYISESSLIGVSFVDYNGNAVTIDSKTIDNIKTYASRNFFNNKIGYYIVSQSNSAGFSYILYAINDYSSNDYISYPNNTLSVRMRTDGTPVYTYATSGHFGITTNEINNNSVKAVIASKPVYPYDPSNNQPVTSINLSGLGISGNELFSTNTDYLERLKGQEEDVIDVIDVTDIKNPIVESRGNTIANISWNRGTRRTDNNNDDDKIATGLVPMDVWYEAIDDEQEDMKDAVVVYDNYIENHPEAQGNYFISTTPITNINNYFNTLPVVNIPTPGTVVNNYYEYNNYNNHNITIYQEPYNAGIIPTFPDFSKKFPFCIPFDLYEFFAVFLAEKEAPKIDIPFPVLDNTQHQLTVEYITIDLSPYEYVSDVLRVMLFIAFCVGLMLLTRHLIKG